MTALSFSLRDDRGHDGSRQLPSIYVADDDDAAADDSLTLTITIEDLPGALGEASLSQVPASVALRIDFGAVVQAARVSAMRVDLPGWRAAIGSDSFPATTYWRLTPAAGTVLANGPMQVRITGIFGDRACTPQGTITVSATGFPAQARASRRLPVAVCAAPNAPGRELQLRVGWVPTGRGHPDPGTVVVSRDTDHEIRNDLRLSIVNADAGQAIVAPGTVWGHGQKAPAFYLGFVYSDEGAGFGALCSTNRARVSAPPTLSVPQEYEGGWDCDVGVSPGTGTPCASFWPKASNQAILGTLAHSSVQLDLGGMVSDLPLDQGKPDVTPMYLFWENIPGYAPGNTALVLNRVDQFGIVDDSLSCTPSDQEAVELDSVVVIEWTTWGAESCSLEDQTGPLTDADPDTHKVWQAVPGDGHHKASIRMTQGRPGRSMVLMVNREGHQPIRRDLHFRIHYPEPALQFARALSISPSVAITREASCTIDHAALAPTQLTLDWQMVRPDLVARYSLRFDEHDGLETEARPGASIDLPAEVTDSKQASHGGQVRVTLVAHASYDETVRNESTATLCYHPPIEGLALEVVTGRQTGGSRLDGGLLVYPGEAGCWVDYRISGLRGDQSALSLTLLNEGRATTRVLPLTRTSLTSPGPSKNDDGSLSYVFYEGTSVMLDKVDLVATGPGGDTARASYLCAGVHGFIKTPDHLLGGTSWHFTPPPDGHVTVTDQAYPILVKAFDIVVNPDLSFSFVGDASSITTYHNQHSSTGLFGWGGGRDDPIANTMSEPYSFDWQPRREDMFMRVIAVQGGVEYTLPGDPQPKIQRFYLRFEIQGSFRATLKFEGCETRFALTMNH